MACVDREVAVGFWVSERDSEAKGNQSVNKKTTEITQEIKVVMVKSKVFI